MDLLGFVLITVFCYLDSVVSLFADCLLIDTEALPPPCDLSDRLEKRKKKVSWQLVCVLDTARVFGWRPFHYVIFSLLFSICSKQKKKLH